MDKNDYYKNMLENLYEGVYFVDKDRRITFWNRGAERITGFQASEVVNHYCYDNILNHVDDDGNYLCLLGCPLGETIKDGKMRDNAIYLHHKNGSRVAVSVKTILIEENGETVGAVEVFNDRKEHHDLLKDLEKLKTLALKDQLTCLPNRRYTENLINTKMYECENLDIPFAVAFIDIDKFKMFNDTYGHDVGDEVLKMTARTLTTALKNADTVGRWGGEEFVAVLSAVDKADLQYVCEKMRMLVEKSALRYDDQLLRVTVSIGAALAKKGKDREELIKRTDELLYQSKEQGRNRVNIGEL